MVSTINQDEYQYQGNQLSAILETVSNINNTDSPTLCHLAKCTEYQLKGQRKLCDFQGKMVVIDEKSRQRILGWDKHVFK
jgi:hypothetical protein